MDFHSDVECGESPTPTHQAIRDALLDCGVAHACCATSWSIGHIKDEEGMTEETELVVFYGHRHLRITPEQEFALVNAMAEAGVPGRLLGDE